MNLKVYLLGISLVIFSLITTVLCCFPIIIVITIPLFIIGCVLIFYSKIQLWIIITSILLIVVSYYPIDRIYNYYKNRTTPITFIIPNNFEGKFVIGHKERCGKELEYENGRILIYVPQNGVVILKEEIEIGYHDYAYYFLDKNGNKKKIKEYKDKYSNIESKKEPGALFFGTGTRKISQYFQDTSKVNNKEIEFLSFFVFNRDSLAHLKKDILFDSVFIDDIYKCRKQHNKLVSL